MPTIDQAGTYQLGDHTVNRLGYGAMQLAGKGVFGPPRDAHEARAVLREAVEHGVDHIDTSDFYGPHVTNQLIREALPAFSASALREAVESNLRNLGLDVLEIVNFRLMFSAHGPAEGDITAPLTAVAELQREGKIRHVGLSNATPAQVEAGRKICPIVCVQNQYNLAHREDDEFIAWLGYHEIAYVPFFPLGGFSPLQSDTLTEVATRLEATPMQVALAWLLARAPNILLIPGTSSRGHLRENIAAASIELPADAMTALDGIATVR